MKTEPDVFSWDDLVSCLNQTSPWEGVRNYQARNFMRDSFRVGDQVFFYHSSCESPGIYGVAEVASNAYDDKTALDSNSPYYDEKSFRDGKSRWKLVDVKAKFKLNKPALLSELRSDPNLSQLLLLRPGQRLSIQPVSDIEARYILEKWNS